MYSQPTNQYCLQVLDDNGNLVTILQLRPSEARGTLGVCLAPDGNNNAETEYLLEVSKQWHQSMAMAKVSTLGSRIWPLTGDFKETRISTSGHYAHKATVYKHNETHSVNRFTSSRY